MREISIYIHIPFCIRKCRYCSFFSVEAPIAERKQYLRNLLKEISTYKGIKERVKSIYIGGGTPTIYSSDDISCIIKACKKNFKVNKDAEISIEANPVTLSIEKLKKLKDAGINRISVGIQSFSDRLLNILGRLHDRNKAIESIKIVKEAGFKSWNTDLMYAIPTQSLKEWKETLEIAVSFQPPHISTYSLILEEGTPIYKLVKEGILKEVEDEGYEMYLWTMDYLKSAGYKHYEISNFAMPGHECVHNLSYWENKPYIGIGTGASSFYHGWRFTRVRDIRKYNSFMERIKIDEKTEQKETMMIGLRLIKGVSKKSFRMRFRKNIYEAFEKELEELKQIGLIEDKEGHIRLTRKGLLLGNQVFEKFV